MCCSTRSWARGHVRCNRRAASMTVAQRRRPSEGRADRADNEPRGGATVGRTAWLTMLCLAGILWRAGWAAEPMTAGSVAHPAIPCRSLKRFAPPDFVVETLELVRPETVKLAPAAVVELPAHCLFRGTLAPRIASDGQHFGIGMELRLPLSWNGKFVFQGGGG